MKLKGFYVPSMLLKMVCNLPIPSMTSMTQRFDTASDWIFSQHPRKDDGHSGAASGALPGIVSVTDKDVSSSGTPGVALPPPGGIGAFGDVVPRLEGGRPAYNLKRLTSSYSFKFASST